MAHDASDNYASVPHYEKRVFSWWRWTQGAALCGVGNNGALIRPFADSFFGKLERLAEGDLVEGAYDAFEATLSEFRTKMGNIPSFSILMAAATRGRSLFLKSAGLIISTAQPVEIMGIEEVSLVKYLIDSVFGPNLDLRQMAALAVLAVYAAKKYCPRYCGGQTDVCVLPKDYTLANEIPLDESQVNELEALLAARTAEQLRDLIEKAAGMMK